MLNKIQHGTPFSVTATHATLASASNAGVAGSTHYITNISVSSDKAGAVWLVKQGTTVIWQGQILATAAGKSVHSENFPIPLAGVAGGLVSVEISGTSLAYANLAGFTL